MEDFSVDDILAEVAAEGSDSDNGISGAGSAAGLGEQGGHADHRHDSMDSADDAALLEALLLEEIGDDNESEYVSDVL